MDEWICLGHRDESSDLERSWLASISVPRYSLEVVQSSNGCIQVSTTLMANEIKFLRISPYSVVTVEDREKIKKE